jgi:hypothetical protein
MQIQINSKSAYAPIRYEATRPFASQMGKRFIAASRQGEKQRLAFIRNELFHTLRKEVEKLPVNGPGPVQSEMLNTQIFGEFQASGKVIFDVARPLAKNLLLSDAESIPCSELEFPFPSFYLHFGTESGLADEGLGIEGAFVVNYDDRFTIDLVPTGFGQAQYFALRAGEVLIGAPIDTSDGSKPILQALEDSIDAVLEKNAKTFLEIEAVEAQLLERYGEIVKVPMSVERLDGKRDILRKALGLVVNTLFYLMAEPDDTIEDWESAAPLDALVALETAQKLGTKKTVENSLFKAGYIKVRHVGRKFANSVSARAVEHASGIGKSVSTHIRRGHFRRQAYGQDHAFRKTIFVAPVVVNAEKGELLQGRIYDVRL